MTWFEVFNTCLFSPVFFFFFYNLNYIIRSIVGSTKSEWADYAAVQAQCVNLAGNELTRDSSGNTRPQSSQLAEPLWTDPGLKEWN